MVLEIKLHILETYNFLFITFEVAKKNVNDISFIFGQHNNALKN